MEKLLITFQATKDLYETIRKEAYLKNVSNSEIIRLACKQYFDLKDTDDGLLNN